MTELQTTEHLIYFMIGNLRLSRYDCRFLENLQRMCSTSQRVTTNQAELVVTLIDKYQRQLTKQGLFIDTLKSLPWSTPIIQTTREFTSAHIGILEDNVIVKTPYNKAFINDFRSNTDSCFVWDNNNKYYIGDLSTYSLKMATTITKKYFTEIRYSDKVKELFSQLEQYKQAIYWKPTLINCNGNYIIASANQSLLDAIQHIELNNELCTMSELARYGISVDDSLLLTDEEHFAAQYNPTVEITDLCEMVSWLKNIKCDYLYVSGMSLTATLKDKHEFKRQIVDAGIHYVENPKYTSQRELNYKCPVAIRFRMVPDFNEPINLAKIVNVVNSQPVNLEKNETM